MIQTGIEYYISFGFQRVILIVPPAFSSFQWPISRGRRLELRDALPRARKPTSERFPSGWWDAERSLTYLAKSLLIFACGIA